MDKKIWGTLEILADYDATLAEVLWVTGKIEDDPQCDNDTLAVAEGVLISILIDKGTLLIPEDPQVQEEVLRSAPGLTEVFDTLPDPLPLLYETSLGYAVALSQGHSGWRPWERVRDFLLTYEDETETEDN